MLFNFDSAVSLSNGVEIRIVHEQRPRKSPTLLFYRTASHDGRLLQTEAKRARERKVPAPAGSPLARYNWTICGGNTLR